MKKALLLLLSFLLCMGLSMTVCAEESMDNQQDDLISLEDLRDLFPQVALGEDGYIISNSSARSSDLVENLQYLENNISDPVQVYTAEYNGGICTLNIYNNDMYVAFGYEEIPVASTHGAGYESQGGTQYRSYYTMSGSGFYYTYNHTTVSGLSKFTNLSSITNPTLGSGILYTITPGRTGYIRTVQNGSNAAEIYGNGTFNSTQLVGGYPYSVELKLITNGNNGTISVRISTSD